MKRALLSFGLASLLCGCSDGHAVAPVDAAPRTVLTAELVEDSDSVFELTGAIRAARETPLAFRITGQIEKREVDSGQRIAAGQRLMSLDPRDVRQDVAAAEANLASAEARAKNAEVDRKRYANLLAADAVSAQAHDSAETEATAASKAASAARAALAQARNASAYAELLAPASGVLVEVNGEVGQVVAPGQAVAVLAHDGEREIEVFVPETRRASLLERGEVRLFGGEAVASAVLREVAGGADPTTRTWRARYRLEGDAAAWPLGATASLRLATSNGVGASSKRVPVGALLDEGEGARLWVVRDSRVEPVAVRVLRIDDEHAWVETELPVGTLVVALGAQLLEPGQAVAPRP